MKEEMEKIKDFREKFDYYDREITNLLIQRFHLSREIGKYKISCNLPVLDTEREKQILEQRKAQAQDGGISPDIIQEIYKVILHESRKVQEELREKRKEEFFTYGKNDEDIELLRVQKGGTNVERVQVSGMSNEIRRGHEEPY